MNAKLYACIRHYKICPKRLSRKLRCDREAEVAELLKHMSHTNTFFLLMTHFVILLDSEHRMIVISLYHDSNLLVLQ